MANQYPAWTDENVALLKTLWAEEMSATQIARRLNGVVSRNAVIGKAHRLGLPPRSEETQRFNQASAQRVRRQREDRVGGAGDLMIKAQTAKQKQATATAARHAWEKAQGRQDSAPLPAPTLIEVKNPSKLLVDLTRTECRWPVSSPPTGQADETLFCAAVCGDETYCTAHSALAVQRTPKAKAYARSVERTVRIHAR